MFNLDIKVSCFLRILSEITKKSIESPQIFKPFAVFLRWGGQEDAVFTVILGGGGGPVIRAGHHAPIIKDGEFIMFNLVPAVGADGYAGGD